MAIRVLSLIVVGALSGCTIQGIRLPKGVYLKECSTHITAEQSRPASCMTRAEYGVARKKLRQSVETTTAERDEGIEEVEEVKAATGPL